MMEVKLRRNPIPTNGGEDSCQIIHNDDLGIHRRCTFECASDGVYGYVGPTPGIHKLLPATVP